jgi:hypothetical protein
MRTTFSVLAVFVGGCVTAPDPAGPRPEGLEITQHTASSLAGSFVRGDVTLQLSATLFADQSIVQTYQLGDLLIRGTSDHAQGVGRIDSNGVTLSAAQKSTLEAFNHALEDALPANEQRVLVEDVVYRMSGYLATAAANEIIPSFDFKNNHSITYIDHCWCSWQYIGCTAGAGCYWHTVGTGWGCVGELPGNGCKGRCGTGCDSDGHSGAFTWDGARHDYNVESWIAASDDFLFAWWNC